MKKILALLLTGVITLTFAACASNQVDNGDGSPTESTTSAQKKELSRGTVNGNVYKSEYLELEFTKPDSWVYSTDEEIASAMNLSVDLLGDKFEQALESNASIYDMMVIDSMTGTNINIGFENLSLSFASNMTEQQYVEALKNQLAGITYMEVEFSEQTETVKLGANDYLRATCTSTVNGISMTQVYYLRNIDGCMSFIIVTIVSGYEIADIEAMFK